MIFFDTETTGLIKNKALPLINQPRIIEIGAVKDTGEELSLIIDPLIKLDPIITKITGLIDKDLEDKPPFRYLYNQLVEFFIGEEKLICHNVPFDLGMLVFELRRISREHQFPYPPVHVDTVDMAKPFYKGKYMKLQALYEDFFGPYEQKHRALDDAKDLQRVYHELMVRGK